MLPLFRGVFFCTTFNTAQTHIKRFYKVATIGHHDDGLKKGNNWTIKLDGKPIKDSQKQVLTVPTAILAHFIAQEFNSQDKYLRPTTMPLLSFAKAATEAQIDVNLRKFMERSFINFLENDTVLFREDDQTKSLYRKQCQKLDPMLEWFNKKYHANLALNKGFEVRPLMDQDREKFQSIIENMSVWELVPLQNVTETLKSAILALALRERRIDAKTCVEYSRIEEQHQIDLCGLVEGHHDVDENNVLMTVAAAELFSNLLISQQMSY